MVYSRLHLRSEICDLAFQISDLRSAFANRRGWTADDADAADQGGWFENCGGIAMLVKSLATLLLLIAGLWATFRPLHPAEERVRTWSEGQRVFVLLTTLAFVALVWSL